MPIAKTKSPRLGRPPGRFTQHKRLSRLREALEAHPSGLVLSDIAAALRVTTRSVRRYLKYLEHETELESLETAPGGAHVWRIKPSERGRALMLRRSQAYGLLAARHVYAPMKGSALYDELDVVTRQLVQLARRPTKGEIASDTRLEDRFLFVPEAPRNYASKGEELDDLFRAVADLRPLTFRYRARADERGEMVKLYPYAMLVHRGAIHAIGLDAARGEVSSYLLDRMSETRTSEAERFELPESFDVSELLQGDFGVGRAPKKQRVLVEFEARVADDVRARRVHPSQKVAAAPDGRVRVSLLVGALDRVASWVLGFGGAARVIEPPELREAVVSELARALGRYH
jgi:predicted DNA-binding transcriptional regulator YafY